MQLSNAFDEFAAIGQAIDPRVREIADWLRATPLAELRERQSVAERAFRQIGITFRVYGDDDAAERIIPFDVIPRVFTSREWEHLSAGLEQRVGALNAFLADVYGDQRILADRVIPAELVLGNPQFANCVAGITPPGGIFAHICGIDLVRTGPTDFHVLEDNARTPSGASYMLENREAMLRICPELFASQSVCPVDSYPDLLLEAMRSVAPQRGCSEPNCVLLTPGPFNSAFYEHSFLADSLGIELVEPADLEVRDDIVWMHTVAGPLRVDVIYRRIDDAYLDPLVFRADSLLGVAGLIGAYRAGNVALVNAPGTGVADDKAIYSYMPEIIRYYTGQDPIIPNVETHRCREPGALAYTLDRLDQLVVKPVDGSGGYGMLVGPAASRAELDAFRAILLAEPHRYIAQPTLALSTVPTLGEAGLVPRHVDFRPFVVSAADRVSVAPGGLTRVALRDGSLVVNSSQGGGTKDTLVLSSDHEHSPCAGQSSPAALEKRSQPAGGRP
jgi:uncharacterized circularly permuted ATP-grasp superfamily protein